MSFSKFKEVEKIFSSKGIYKIYVRELQEKQDNTKNQIYFGTGSVLNLLPCEIKTGSQSISISKKKSLEGKNKIEAKLDFSWFDNEGNLYNAPNAQLIFYFQYPEVRLSGFFKGCGIRADCLRRENQANYGRRILIIGIKDNAKIFALVLNQKEHPVVLDFPVLKEDKSVDIFLSHNISQSNNFKDHQDVLDFPDPKKDKSVEIFQSQNIISSNKIYASSPYDELIDRMKDICGKWHSSKRLINRNDGPIPFAGNQGCGLTLEALLGIEMNSSKKPDFKGIEIKSYKKGGSISLMTPQPDAGERSKLSFREFMNNYGWNSSNPNHHGRIVFTGPFRIGQINEKKGYDLRLKGYDNLKNKFFSDDIYVGLYRISDNQLVASWSGQKLLEHWIKKHSEALYVQYESQKITDHNGKKVQQYLYNGKCLYGRGTSIINFFNALSQSLIVYDPADEIYEDGTPKSRSQWRVNVSTFEKKMDVFYDYFEEINLKK